MCLNTKKIFPRGEGVKIIENIILAQVVETSPTDIICYKGFNLTGKTLRTPFQSLKWPKDRVVEVKEFGIENVNCAYGYFEVHEGLHANTKKETYCPGDIQLTMVIPANTPFIRSHSGDTIVALKMRLETLEPSTPKKKATKKKAAKKKKK